MSDAVIITSLICFTLLIVCGIDRTRHQKQITTYIYNDRGEVSEVRHEHTD